jgi:hypothetical protein
LKDAGITKKYIIEISAISFKFVLNLLADKGKVGAVVSKIPATALSKYLVKSFPQNLPDYSNKRFVLLENKKTNFSRRVSKLGNKIKKFR